MKTYLTVLTALAAVAVSGSVTAERIQARSYPAPEVRSEGQSASALQPADQGVSTPDLLTTRDINEEIARDSRISRSGRDTRVSTYRGRVVLRGTVSSTDEKRRLEEIAAQRAGAQNVQNEIQVKAGSDEP